MDTSDDDWTPWVGWRKAARQLPLRLLGGWAVCFGGLAVTRVAFQSGSGQVGRAGGRIIFGVTLLCGAVAGAIASRKLAENTGLIGKQLIVPVWIFLLAGVVGVRELVVTFWPDPDDLSSMALYTAGIAGCAVAGLQLLLDS